MATLALAAVGAAVGGYIAPGVVALGMTGASIGWTVGAIAGNMLFAPRTKSYGPRLQDLSVTSSAYGIAVPTCWGTVRTAGNVIWAAPIEESSNTQTAGKGGGKSSYTTYTYFATFAVALCEGEITSVTRIWANGKLVYDIRDTADPSMVAASDELAEKMEVYVGSETQTASPVIESFEGAGEAPAYRGTAYVVFQHLPLANYGNVVPNLEFEVIVDGSNDVPTLALDYTAIEADALPPNAARMDGDRLILSKGDDDVGYVSQYRTVMNADADSVVLNAFAEGVLTPEGYTLVETNPNQVRNNPDVRVICLTNDDTSQQTLYFGYTGSLASGSEVHGTMARFWKQPSNIGPFVTMMLGDQNTYIFQSPFYIVADSGANQSVVLAKQQLGLTIESAAQPITLTCELPAGMTFTGGANDQIQTTYIAADDQRKCIIVGGVQNVDNSVTLVIDAETMDVVAVYDELTNVVGAGFGRAIVWVLQSSSHYLRVYDISANGGTVASPLTPTLLGESAALSQVPYLGMPAPDSGLVMLSNELWRYADAITDAPPTLEEIVEGICVAAGYEQADIDASDLAAISVQGYIRRERMTGAAMLAPLTQTYGFDIAEVDGQIVAKLRGATADATLSSDDLVADPGQPAMQTRRAQETELPQQLDVSYLSYPADYAVGSQSAQRIVTESIQVASLDLPVVMPDTEAAERARRMLWEAWIARTSRTFSLGPKWSKLVPTDVVTVPVGTGTTTARLTRVSRSGIRLDCEAVDVDAAAFTQPSVAGDIPTPDGGTSVIASSVLAVMNDLPPLRDLDDSYGFYAAASSYSATWPGALITLEPDGHQDPASVGTVTSRSTIGAATEALADFAPKDQRFDTTNSVEVAFSAGDLPATVTITDILESQANTFCIGSEIVKAMTVTTVSGNVVRLSNLIRGIQGTPTDGHAAGDKVVLLDSTVLPVRYESGWVGTTGKVRATTFGAPTSKGTVGGLTFSSDRVKPLPVANLRATRLSNLDVLIQWERRAKTRNTWADGADVSLDETSEAYELDIYNAAGTTIARTVTGQTSDAYTYTAANVLTDQGSARPTQLIIEAYQVGDAGRGRTETRTVSVLTATSPIVLLLHYEGANGATSYSDSSPYNHTITRVGSASVTIATANYKFGSSSSYWNNVSQSGAYLRIDDDSSLRLGTGDFTIDCWVVRTGNNNVQGLIHKRVSRLADNNGDWQFYSDYANDGKPAFRYVASDTVYTKTFDTALTLSVWQHIAITRSGNTFRGFLNGTKAVEWTDANANFDKGGYVYLGSATDGAGASITQYVDEMRVLKGYAAWTSNFTPPNAAY